MEISAAARRLQEVVKPVETMTIASLARRVGVTPQAAHRWVVGTAKPTAKYRKKIEKITGIPADAWDRPVENDATSPEAA